jgi:5'-3' exonuclease
VASRNSDPWEKVGMAIHLTMSSVNQAVRLFGINHVVFCLEGRAWRKDIYPQYKAHRKVAESAMTEEEAEENKLFWETYDAFTAYLREKTNCSVLRHPQAEADDLIARFIDLHPNDEHWIISSDTDYVQLISENVKQYNGVAGQLITLEGYFTDKGKPVIDKKTNQHKILGDPEFLLFEKCMRGDSGDNVFSAYPGVRVKGTKDKVGLLEAFADRTKQGFSWNNMMLQKWLDHDGNEHTVRKDYERNRLLIDLKAQPADIKTAIDEQVVQDLKSAPVPQVGIHLLKFCAKYELNKISEYADSYGKWLNSSYTGALKS